MGKDNSPNVTLYSSLNEDRQWNGRLSRVESAIDSKSRQLHVIARIDGSLGEERASDIKIGEYLTANIKGSVIPDAIVIPNQSIYQASFVYIVENDTLQRRNIDIIWQDSERALIASGLNDGDILVTTPLGQVTSGTRVKIAEPTNNGISIAGGAAANAGQGAN